MLGNYFKENTPLIKKTTLALKGLIGTLAVSQYAQGDPKLAFWLLVAGAVIDFALQFFPPDKNTLKAVIILFAFSALFSGCKIIKPKEVTTIKDSVAINYRTVDVPVKGAKVSQSINVDSLFSVWLKKYKQYQKDSTAAVHSGKPIPARPELPHQKVTDPQSKAELTYWIDQYGKLQASCESKDQVLKAVVAEINKMRQEITKKDVVVTKMPVLGWLLIGSLSALIILLFIKSINPLKR
ncbi:MAG: hypothetical protein IE931_05545 [Sphingobacteriales bacterium]|nr:hypothetical protein [Sphingobacteriales bacterium]